VEREKWKSQTFNWEIQHLEEEEKEVTILIFVILHGLL
jgi:hypothetical protein